MSDRSSNKAESSSTRPRTSDGAAVVAGDVLDNIPENADIKWIAFIGYPVRQALAPQMLNALYSAEGVDRLVVPLSVPPSAFAPVLSSFSCIENFVGFIVTIPHKVAAADAAQRKSPRVKLAGVANVLRKSGVGCWSADIFDGVGLMNALDAENSRIVGANIFICGAGGAGTAIAWAFLERQVESIYIADSDEARAEKLVSRLNASAGRCLAKVATRPNAEATIVVNATPIGMNDPEAMPFELDRIGSTAVVVDAVMKPPLTKLLRDAARLGHRIVPGSEILKGQIRDLHDFFLGG